MSEKSDIVITVEKREAAGGGAAQKLRREGRIPAVVYGGDKASVSISVDAEDLKTLLKSGGGENTIFLLKLKGTKEERRAMIRELQRNPLTGAFEHIDFIRVTRGQKLNVTIRIELKGDSEGVRHGGRLDFVTREVDVEVLPREMFDKIVVDVSHLEIGDHITLGELEDKLPESARFLTEPSRVVCLVEAPRAVAEEEEEEGEELETVLDEQAEPEVISKRRDEEEGE